MVAPEKNQQFPELEKLVDSIKQGQRVVLFPPGIVNFIAVNILLIISFVTFSSPLLNVIGAEWKVSTQATAQLFSILIAIISIVIPALFITRGRKKLQRWFLFLSSFLAFSAALVIVLGSIMNVESLQSQTPLLAVCIVLSSIAAFLAQSSGYRTLVYFYFLMRKK